MSKIFGSLNPNVIFLITLPNIIDAINDINNINNNNENNDNLRSNLIHIIRANLNDNLRSIINIVINDSIDLDDIVNLNIILITNFSANIDYVITTIRSIITIDRHNNNNLL